tara:strand:- start:478 stop:702 length:225 start_codon:yes stop_codon:yes gene_type:complete
MARKKQTYTIGEPQKKKEVKKITHAIPPSPKKSKPNKNKQRSFQSKEPKGIVMNNAFAEAFKKAGLSAKDFTKK